MKNFNKKQKILLLIIVLIISIMYYMYKINNKKILIDEEKDVLAETIDDDNISIENNENKIDIQEMIVVDVSGEVCNKGVYSLDLGSRVIDAINKAGGFTENADTSQINLASKLEDGMKIFIPKIGENSDDMQIPQEILSTDINGGNNKMDYKVNINKANLDELQTLPGVGSTIANRIIEYRKENGNFEKIEDLKKIKGIGENKFKEIQDFICI